MMRRNVLEWCRACNIPEHMHEGVDRWVNDGCEPGHFLTHILENDFAHAAERADLANQRSLFNYARLLIVYLPMACWGSKENMKEWREHGGYVGLQKRMDTPEARLVHGEEPMEPQALD